MIDQAEAAAHDPPVACFLSERELAIRGEELARGLFARVEMVEELAEGYAYRFPAEEAWARRLLDFVAAERRYCPLFRHEIAFEPNQGPVRPRLVGSEAAKAFARERFAAGVVTGEPVADGAPGERVSAKREPEGCGGKGDGSVVVGARPRLSRVRP